ncbi:uncharacterized protein G2W53_038030 [Senna tora]|uniref:Uncharacterized protein n=1 Tax=Senna tora TaxID=362788 RepID=A0A834SL46_9FABA|nr:uncharacterized protein G2W53_038030 [Senna tora]
MDQYKSESLGKEDSRDALIPLGCWVLRLDSTSSREAKEAEFCWGDAEVDIWCLEAQVIITFTVNIPLLPRPLQLAMPMVFHIIVGSSRIPMSNLKGSNAAAREQIIFYLFVREKEKNKAQGIHNQQATST